MEIGGRIASGTAIESHAGAVTERVRVREK